MFWIFVLQCSPLHGLQPRRIPGNPEHAAMIQMISCASLTSSQISSGMIMMPVYLSEHENYMGHITKWTSSVKTVTDITMLSLW